MANTNKNATAPIIPSNSNGKEIAPKADIVLFVSAINSNPNGDPDDEGRPRLTDDAHAVMTSISIKRKIRDTVEYYRTNESVDMFANRKDTNQIFVRPGTIRTEQVKESIDLKRCPSVVKALSAKESSDDKKKATPVTREDRVYVAEQLCDKFFDVRAFGNVLGTVGGLLGAVQIENAVSVNELYINDMTITTCQVANKAEAESKDRSMGRRSGVEYALFPIFIHVNGVVAAQNGFTREDFNNLIALFKEMWDVTNSSVRTLQFEKMYVFEHENVRGNMPMKDIRKAIQIVPRVEKPKSFDDYDVSLDPIVVKGVKGIKLTEY